MKYLYQFKINGNSVGENVRHVEKPKVINKFQNWKEILFFSSWTSLPDNFLSPYIPKLTFFSATTILLEASEIYPSNRIELSMHLFYFP